VAGHSKYSNIKHRKGAQDAKRAKIFTRLIREILVAAKAGPDPDGNPRLRTAIIAARAGNMPKDRIDNAISKASGADAASYDEIRYEAYGVGGTAFIVECLTDNHNRSASEVRAIFSKFAGSLAETGSVSFMFEHMGVVRFPQEVASEDEIFEQAVEYGAESVETEGELHIITSQVVDFIAMRDKLIEKYGDPQSAALEWLPKNLVAVNAEHATTLLKMLDALDENDDVQNVYTNTDFPEEEVGS
jgi:YebC/PmpR family DNA-binding regulatory protein